MKYYKSSTIPNKIIILGGSHHNGLGIIRSLGEIGCELYFVSLNSKKNFVSKSKYIKGVWYVNNNEEALTLLLNEFSCEKIPPIILPSDDNSVYLISEFSYMLKSKFVFSYVNSQESLLHNLMNKHDLNRLAIKLGINVPKSIILDLEYNNKKLITSAECEVGYPCILKPLQSIDGKKSDITIVNNTSELSNVIDILRKKYKSIILQQYIVKDGEIGIQGVALSKNEIYIAGYIDKIRVSTKAQGSTTYAKLSSKNNMVDEKHIISLVKEVGHEGIFDIEFIYCNKTMYFIEMNLRNGAYGYAFTKAGINMPELWCKSAIGQCIDNDNKKVNKSILLMNEFADFRNVLDKKTRLFRWIHEFLGTDVYLIFNRKDIKPFIFKILYGIFRTT